MINSPINDKYNFKDNIWNYNIYQQRSFLNFIYKNIKNEIKQAFI